jgi:hypothetical protein
MSASEFPSTVGWLAAESIRSTANSGCIAASVEGAGKQASDRRDRHTVLGLDSGHEAVDNFTDSVVTESLKTN